MNTEIGDVPLRLTSICLRINSDHAVKLECLNEVLDSLSVELTSGSVNFSFPASELMEPLIDFTRPKS